MRRIIAAFSIGVLWTLCADERLSLHTGQDRPVFRTSADAVLVDVAVLRGKAPVGGLSAADFELRDNQVLQRLEAVWAGEVPIDLSMLVDASASVTGDTGMQIVNGANQIARLLRPGDALQVVVAGDRLQRVAVDDVKATVLGRRMYLSDGGTALYDGLTVLLMQRSRPGRRHVILALTDAVDTHSVVSESALRATAARSDASAYMIALFDPAHVRAFGFVYPADGIFPTTFDQTVSALVEASGGRFVPLSNQQQFVPTCLAILEELRARYTLSYVPRGVVAEGWHDLAVHVTSGRYEVRARRGYQR